MITLGNNAVSWFAIFVSIACGEQSDSKRLPLRVIAGLTGPLLLGLGSGISISAGFGSFGFSVLLDGINSTSGQPLWVSQIVITLVFYLIAWCWARIPLGVGTLPALLLIGPAISLGAAITPDTQLLVGNFLAFATGLILFALGISLAAAAALGPDGITALSLAAEKKHGCSIPRANFTWNFLAIFLGILLGGNFGPATIVGLFVTPMLIKLFVPFIRNQLASDTTERNSTMVKPSPRHLVSEQDRFYSIHFEKPGPITTHTSSGKSRLNFPNSCYDIIL